MITHTRRHRARSLRRLAVATCAALALAACGSDSNDADGADDDGSATTDTTDGSMDDDAMGDAATDDDGMDDSSGGAMGDMDMADMNMGDAGLTPASDVEGAALASGSFELLDTRPQGYDDLGGTSTIARHADGTTVTVELTGLPPDTDFVSHLHAQACADDNGGPHYQFVESDDIVTPPNEIHLAFTSDADGNGFMTAENAAVAGPEALAVVVHPAEFVDNKAACVDFEADDPDAVAAAIENGPAFDPAVLDHSGRENEGEMEADDS